MSQLPPAKIRKIAKFDPAVQMVNKEGAQALTIACELFIASLSKEIFKQSRLAKRKTLQLRDFNDCLSTLPWLEFLDGAFVGWLDAAVLKEMNAETGIEAAEEEGQSEEFSAAAEKTASMDMELQEDAPMSEDLIDSETQEKFGSQLGTTIEESVGSLDLFFNEETLDVPAPADVSPTDLVD